MNVPALRFKVENFDVPKPWEEDNLLNLSVDGFTNGVFNDPNKTGSGYKLINVLDMYIDTTIDEKRLSLVELSDAEFKKNKVEHGEIFFTRSSLVKEGIAYSNVYLGHSQDITFDGHLIRMSPKKEVLNSVFTNYLLRTSKVRKQLVARGKTATMTTIGQADIAAVMIAFPSLPEQTKIANFLTAVDEKITQLTQKNALLTQYKKGVMQKIFSQKLRFKDDNGQDFPEWKEKLVGEVFNDFKGTGLSKDKIGEVGKNKCILYGHLFTRYSEVITDIESRTDFKEGLTSVAGDILMPSSTTTKGIDLAKASSLNQSGVLLGGDIIVLRLKEKGNSNFFAYFLTHAKSKDIAEITQGTTIIHLYFSQLKNILLNYPCDKEQTKIANFLTALDDKITAIQTQLQAVKQYKQGLLQQMFV